MANAVVKIESAKDFVGSDMYLYSPAGFLTQKNRNREESGKDSVQMALGRAIGKHSMAETK